MKQRPLAALTVLSFVGASIVTAIPAMADHGPEPTDVVIVDGGLGSESSECAVLAGDDAIALKLNENADGEYSFDTVGNWTTGDGITSLDVEIDTHPAFGRTLTFENADPNVLGVYLKGGNGGVYYSFAPDGTSHGGPLEVPTGPGQGLSHVTFCFGEDGDPGEQFEELTVTKTAETSYDRQNLWELAKSADLTTVLLYTDGSGDGDVTWTIDVTKLDPVDSNYLVQGEITIENTGDLAAMVTDIVDVLDVDGPSVLGVTCTQTTDAGIIAVVPSDIAPYLLMPGDVIDCTYSAMPGGAVDGMNTAFVTTMEDTYLSDEIAVTWGDPTNEFDASVTLTDVMAPSAGAPALPNGFLPADVGPYTDSAQVTYTNTFTWADYGQDLCGDHRYDNTATLTGSDSGVIATAMESVDVRVQCFVFDGETAWAANEGPGTEPYNVTRGKGKKGGGTGGNWATYVVAPVDGSEATYDLYAGQTTHVGTATVSAASGGSVTVTVDLVDPWLYAPDVANLKIQDYAEAPSGNPAPGQFEFHTVCDGNPCTSGAVDANAYYGIHVDVGQWIPDPGFGL